MKKLLVLLGLGIAGCLVFSGVKRALEPASGRGVSVRFAGFSTNFWGNKVAIFDDLRHVEGVWLGCKAVNRKTADGWTNDIFGEEDLRRHFEHHLLPLVLLSVPVSTTNEPLQVVFQIGERTMSDRFRDARRFLTKGDTARSFTGRDYFIINETTVGKFWTAPAKR